MTTGEAPNTETTSPDPDAVLCALVLAPNSFSRNKFFSLFENAQLRRMRRRAKRVRAVIRQILGQGREPAQIVGEQILEDRVLIRLQIQQLAFQRTTSLSLLEASLIRYALSRARGDELRQVDRNRVESALKRLAPGLLPPPTLSAKDN